MAAQTKEMPDCLEERMSSSMSISMSISISIRTLVSGSQDRADSE